MYRRTSEGLGGVHVHAWDQDLLSKTENINSFGYPTQGRIYAIGYMDQDLFVTLNPKPLNRINPKLWP